MNLQQLKYIVAINRFRNFAKAADSCNISQPTLSAMLLKLEEELDVRIFDRTNKQVTPTSAGEKIILQAKKTLLELEKITELVAEEKNQIGKSLSLSVGPSIAPYILPKFIKHYRKDYPEVNLSIQEMKSEEMFHVLQDGEIDAGIAISDLSRKGYEGVDFYRLDKEEGNHPPEPFGRKITQWDENQSIDGIGEEDVAIKEGGVHDTEHCQEEHSPGESTRKAISTLLLIIIHDKEA